MNNPETSSEKSHKLRQSANISGMDIARRRLSDVKAQYAS